MSVRTRWIPAFGFSVSALAVGVPYFLIPYRELNLPGALYEPGLCVLVGSIVSALCAFMGSLLGWIISKLRGRDGANAR